MHPLPRPSRSRPAGHHPIVSGVLVLALVSVLAASAAVGVRPAPADAQSTALSTATITPETALVYAALNVDTASAQFRSAQALAERAGLLDALDLAEMGDMPVEDELNVEFFLGGEVAFVALDGTALELAGDGATGTAEDLLAGTPEVATPAVSADPTDGSAGFAILVRAADPAAAYAEAQRLNGEQASTVGVDVQETDYNGTTIESVAGSADGETDPVAVAQVGDFVVVAGYTADIEPFIDTAAGDVAPLSEVAAFTDVQAELNPEFLLFSYIDGPAIRALLEESPQTGVLTDETLAAFDANTGIVVWADEPGFRLDTVSLPTEGAAPLPGTDNFDTALDERVPSDTLIFSNGTDLGASGTGDVLGLLLAQAINGEEPGAAPPEGVTGEEYADQQFEQAARTLGFDLRSDLFDLLAGEYGVAISVPDIATLTNPDSLFAIVASGVSDPATAARSIGSLATGLAGLVEGGGEGTTSFSTREVDGSTVYTAEDTSTDLPITAELGVVGDQLLLGLGDSIDTFVTGPTESLADDPVYREVLATLPAEHGGTLYIDLAQAISLAQTLFVLSEGASGTTNGIEDASEDCAAYADQAEAQDAYDADPSLIDLDQDFDGEACEDFFAQPEASPAPTFGELDLSALVAFAQVRYSRDGLRGTSAILYIASEAADGATPAATP